MNDPQLQSQWVTNIKILRWNPCQHHELVHLFLQSTTDTNSFHKILEKKLFIFSYYGNSF